MSYSLKRGKNRFFISITTSLMPNSMSFVGDVLCLGLESNFSAPTIKNRICCIVLRPKSICRFHHCYERGFCNELCIHRPRKTRKPETGTAVHIKRWICLEIPQGWLPKFKIHDLNISREAKEAIQKGLEIPLTRLQLIRGDRQDRHGLVAFVCDEHGLYMCHVDDPHKWAQFDWTDFSSFTPCEQELTLICTHGSRDACCGTLGGKLYKNLLEQEANTPKENLPTIWQTSHLGGHRFAPTILQFPSALISAFVVTEEIMDSQIPIEKWRGHSFVGPATQFAEIQMRHQGITPLTCTEDRRDGFLYFVSWVGVTKEQETFLYSFEIEKKGHGCFSQTSCKKEEEKEIKSFVIVSTTKEIFCDIFFLS